MLPVDALHEFGERMRSFNPGDNGSGSGMPMGNTPLDNIPLEMDPMAGGAITQSPAMLQGNIVQHQHMGPQHISPHALMGPPQQPMMAGPSGQFSRQSISGPAGTPTMPAAVAPNQNGQPSPHGRPASSQDQIPGGSANPPQQRPSSTTGNGPSGSFAMHPPPPPGPSTGKRKATMDQGNETGVEQAPPTRRQRTATSGPVSGAGVTFVDGADTKESPMNTRARGRKSPVINTKAPPGSKGKRRGTNA